VDRLPSDCKIRWINCEDPLVETGPWSKSEDMKLLSIAQRQGMVDWASIAQQLGTRRTVAQCFVRFQRSLNASILRSAWTPEEDLQLRAAVEKFGEDWQAVAASMEGRIGSQCAHRSPFMPTWLNSSNFLILAIS
jgi:myb proto-oncogene protein